MRTGLVIAGLIFICIVVWYYEETIGSDKGASQQASAAPDEGGSYSPSGSFEEPVNGGASKGGNCTSAQFYANNPSDPCSSTYSPPPGYYQDNDGNLVPNSTQGKKG